MPKGAAHFIAFVLVIGAIVLAQQFRESSGRRHFGGVVAGGGAEPAAVQDDGISVYFSPHGGCEAAVVAQIDKAQHKIDMQAYGFTSVAIAQALADAQARGLTVRAVLDQKATAENDLQAVYLKDHGVSEFTDGEHPIAHNKVMILDERTVITGSFNFTRQAENSNAENLIILSDRPVIAAAYERNFEMHLSHSQEFTGAIQPYREHQR